MQSANLPFMSQLEGTLYEYLHNRTPHLPNEWKELLVKIAPYITILFVVLSIPVILAAIGVGAFFSPFMALGGGIQAVAGFSIAIIFYIISVVLEGLAIPGLFARNKRAWQLMYYSALVNAIYNFVTFNLFGFLIGTVISLYLLFQIKSYYTR